MSTNVIRGMDHVGITVSDIDEATRFFSDAFGAEVIYDSVSPSDDDVKGEETEKYSEPVPGNENYHGQNDEAEARPGTGTF